jgi:endonuclease/exonuclease/phosphatase (EEP) superfamily protein YafD
MPKAQLDAFHSVILWVHSQRPFALRVCPAWDEEGVGYHALFEQWNHNHHSCPGPARIKQFNDVTVPWLAAQAHPPKPKPVATIAVIHASGKASKPAATGEQMTAALDAYAPQADVITLTEVAGAEMRTTLVAWAKANGWHLYHPPLLGQRECAILSRRPFTAARAHRLTDLTLKTGRTAPLYLVSAHIKGTPWVGVWHSPAHNEGLKPGLWPTRVYRSALVGLRAARMKMRHGGGVVICGDWNLRPALLERVSPLKRLKWAGEVGQKPTEGGRVIDGVLTNLDVVTPAVTLPRQPGFDHRAVRVVLAKR